MACYSMNVFTLQTFSLTLQYEILKDEIRCHAIHADACEVSCVFFFFFNKLMIENEDIQTYLAFEPPHHHRGEMML